MVQQCWPLLALLTLAGAMRFVGRVSALNVALHAQVDPTNMIVGSAITTAGLQSAFREVLPAGEEHRVEIFYPFSYDGMVLVGGGQAGEEHEQEQQQQLMWDLVLIEGWFPMISAFLHEIRGANPDAIVVFYALDPSYPGREILQELSVDAFLTNSVAFHDELSQFAPVRLVPLAADPDTMQPRPREPRYASRVAYIGAGGPMLQFKKDLPWMLREAKQAGGLRVYGTGWGARGAEWAEIWGGVLPQEDIAIVYSSADVVLAGTMDDQRAQGMINNRVFEALACGAIVISDHFPALEAMFGDYLLFARKPGDVTNLLHEVSTWSEEQKAAFRKRAREAIVQDHTYVSRVQQILAFYSTLRKRQPRSDANAVPVHIWGSGFPLHPHLPCTVRQCIRIAVLLAEEDAKQATGVIKHIVWPAIARQPRSTYAVSLYLMAEAASASDAAATWYTLDEGGQVTATDSVLRDDTVDVVVGVSSIGGRLDSTLRHRYVDELNESRLMTRRGLPQFLGLVALGRDAEAGRASTGAHLRDAYDMLWLLSQWDIDTLVADARQNTRHMTNAGMGRSAELLFPHDELPNSLQHLSGLTIPRQHNFTSNGLDAEDKYCLVVTPDIFWGQHEQGAVDDAPEIDFLRWIGPGKLRVVFVGDFSQAQFPCTLYAEDSSSHSSSLESWLAHVVESTGADRVQAVRQFRNGLVRPALQHILAWPDLSYTVAPWNGRDDISELAATVQRCGAHVIMPRAVTVHDCALPSPAAAAPTAAHADDSGSSASSAPWRAEGDDMVVLAGRFGARISLTRPWPRIVSMAKAGVTGWDSDYQAASFRKGLTRMFSLGRGSAAVRWAQPLTERKDEELSTLPVQIHYFTSHVQLGRDGQICLVHFPYADSAANVSWGPAHMLPSDEMEYIDTAAAESASEQAVRETLSCVLRDDVDLFLNITRTHDHGHVTHATEANVQEVVLAMDVRGSVFNDVVYRSRPVTLRVAAQPHYLGKVRPTSPTGHFVVSNLKLETALMKQRAGR